MTRCGAVVVAAGSSRRMGSLDKIVQVIGGRPAFAWVLDALAAVSEIEELVVVTGPGNAAAVTAALAAWPGGRIAATCPGGATRAESVAAGVRKLSPAMDLILIHDGARPLVTPALCAAGIRAARVGGAAIAGVAVSDTIKRVDASGRVIATLQREELVAVQTPQVFRRDWLETAYRACADAWTAATDEASLLERAGFPVQVFPGDPENLKLTTPSDLVVADALLRHRRAALEP